MTYKQWRKNEGNQWKTVNGSQYQGPSYIDIIGIKQQGYFFIYTDLILCKLKETETNKLIP